jgi:transposase
MRLRRYLKDNPWFALWKMEFQQRGTVHYHIVLNVQNTVPISEMRTFVSNAWSEIVQDPQLAITGTRVDEISLESVRQVIFYLVGHATTHRKDYQNSALRADWVGRWFGVWNPPEVPAVEVTITESELHRLKRTLAKRLSSNCRASGILSAMETITRKPYETDLTDDEWAILEPVLKRALYGDKTKTRGHPRHYPLREIVNAILYVLKTGCQWRNLPHDLPPWKTVYYHFRRWEKRGVLAQIRDTLVEQARAQAGKAAPKHLAVDSQSVPSTAKGGHAAMTGARR